VVKDSNGNYQPYPTGTSFSVVSGCTTWDDATEASGWVSAVEYGDNPQSPVTLFDSGTVAGGPFGGYPCYISITCPDGAGGGATTILGKGIDLFTGAANNATFDGCVSIDSGTPSADATITDGTVDLEVAVTVTVDPDHVGDSGKFFAVMGYTPPNGSSTSTWLNVPAGGPELNDLLAAQWTSVMLNPLNLVPLFPVDTLSAQSKEVEVIHIPKQKLGLPGTFSFFVGYQTSDSVILHSSPLVLTVE
jgi:hypothetical protein